MRVLKWAGATLALALSVASAPVQAQTVSLGAVLSGTQEVPPNASPATGVGTVFYDQGAGLITTTLTVSGLTGQTVGVGPGGAPAHIHFAPPGSNGPIVVPLVGAPVGATFFSFAETFSFAQLLGFGVSQTNVNNLRGALDAAIGAPVGAVVPLYFNVHTTAFPGGEIRGNLAVVPEPGTWALLGTGLLAVGGVAVRRRRVA